MVDSLLWLYLAVFIILILLEVPVAFSMLMSTFLYLLINGENFIMFAQKLSFSMADYNMLAVPAFLFVGTFMNEMGLTDRLFTAAEKWIGHLPGGLAHANVLASMIFAGMSGSAMADAGGLGSIEVKAMKDAGYDEDFSIAVTAASSAIGPVIPPSINFCIWAFLTSSSTMAMFVGGIIPGVLMGVSMMIWIVIAVKKYRIKAPTVQRASWRERWLYTFRSLPAVGGPAILIIGIMSGIFTPTECGVVAVAYCVLVSVAYRKFNRRMLTRALCDALSSSAMCIFLCATGLVFNWLVVTSGLTAMFARLLLSLGSTYVILIVLNIILLIMGCFIGSMQALIMVTPLLVTLCESLGISLIHMGVLAVLNLTIGVITPPMAPALFMTVKVAGGSFKRALKYSNQFLIPLVVTLLLVTFIPGLVTWLPTVMGLMK